MQFLDAVTVAGTRRTAEGYLIAEARSVRTGIQLYTGDEVGRPDLSVVRVYRGPDQVFAQDSLQSFSHAPITNNHPAESVTADNWKELSVGEVSTAAKKDGDWVLLPLILKDAAAIAAVEAGKRQLSAGYVCSLDWTAGVTADGQAYDAQQRSIKINHLALVDAARAGAQARIGDAQNWGISPMRDGQQGDPVNQPRPDHPTGGPNVADTLRTVTVDSVPYNMNDQVAALVERMQGLLRDSGKALTDAQAAHKAGLDAKDAALAAKDAEITDLKGKVLDAAGLDVLVADRAAIMAKAKALAPTLDCAGKSNMDIKRAVLGDAAKDKSDAYVDAAWDLRNETSASKPLQDAIRNGLTVVTGDAAAVERAALTQANDDLNAWRSPAKAAV